MVAKSLKHFFRISKATLILLYALFNHVPAKGICIHTEREVVLESKKGYTLKGQTRLPLQDDESLWDLEGTIPKN